jgi:hypothetical protein
LGELGCYCLYAPFFFPDVILKQEAFYWAGALLAVAGGSMLAKRLPTKKDTAFRKGKFVVSVAFTLAALA